MHAFRQKERGALTADLFDARERAKQLQKEMETLLAQKSAAGNTH